MTETRQFHDNECYNLPIHYCLFRPFRGHARSHRNSVAPKGGASSVGAGVPAKGPEQASKGAQATTTRLRPSCLAR
ncbi:hypothetical protein CXG45_08460 [Pseudomonas plecoglossicida]|uniref:Uncharacterized protein n=1 Tax=Pseudomonas plecoglossicida TaxID=70775 RepID=A0ABX4U0K3_PSEDL|nr:hypothetical protein CXG44_18975 [Pseudomonas plecoglossicida]PLU94189.1 hypothetical protein CXG45_08460 [Pseudomonas plecoglossicida]PLV05031.1 hypothetical protein CXG48_08320 [Pseudomonas plecoglossicida]PLV14149.1 hypothetical protein CXG47_12155 [Pseudomonas plecoglossicida]QKK96530.1 hypothetical protein GEV38_11225 [Pseudomonas sp. 13159349]